MPSKIRLKRSTTASSTPTGLEAGEIAVNITDKRLFVGDGTNSQELTRRAASSTAGRVQLAASTGALTDTANLSFNDTTITLAANTTRLEASGDFRGLYSSANPGVVLAVTHDNGGPVSVGDASQAGNGTNITVDDLNSLIYINGPAQCSNSLFAPLLTCTPWLGAAGRVFLQNAAGNRTMTLSAPTTIASDFTLTLPGNAGSNDQVLTTNGSGTLSWTSKGGFTPTQNEYTTSGTSTVTIPSGCTSFRITCIGGGGGGGGGRCNAYLSARGGGGGGGGGGWMQMHWRVSDVGTAGSTVLSVTVGAGGTSGAAQTTDLSNGGNGGAGGASSVSRNSDSLVLISVAGGNGGNGGQSGSAGGGGSFTPAPVMFTGGSGGNGNLNSVATSGVQAAIGPSGGGGGGGVSSTGTGQKAGADGFRTSQMLSTTLVATGGAAVDTGTAGDGANAIEYLPGAVGGGGGGGGGANQGKGGNGGNGFRGGGGGGGGAGAAAGGGSGAGGVGGAGYVRIEWF